MLLGVRSDTFNYSVPNTIVIGPGLPCDDSNSVSSSLDDCRFYYKHYLSGAAACEIVHLFLRIDHRPSLHTHWIQAHGASPEINIMPSLWGIVLHRYWLDYKLIRQPTMWNNRTVKWGAIAILSTGSFLIYQAVNKDESILAIITLCQADTIVNIFCANMTFPPRFYRSSNTLLFKLGKCVCQRYLVENRIMSWIRKVASSLLFTEKTEESSIGKKDRRKVKNKQSGSNQIGAWEENSSVSLQHSFQVSAHNEGDNSSDQQVGSFDEKAYYTRLDDERKHSTTHAVDWNA